MTTETIINSAKLVAHERMLAHLLSPQLANLSVAQRAMLEEAIAKPPTLPSFGADLEIGTADDLAAMALDYRDAMKRIFQLALPESDPAAG
jgi:hypothetical protein